MARASITGLRMSDQALEWTTLREGKNGVEVIAARALNLALDEAARADPQKRAAALQQQCPDLQGTITLGLPSNQVLLRVVELPTLDPVEIESMIQLQLDKFSPYPTERMVVSYETLKVADGSCRILIAAVQKEIIEALGALFNQTALVLRRIDVEALSWWRLLQDRRVAPGDGRHLVLRLDASGGLLIAVQDGVPLAFKTMNPSAGLSPEEYAAEIAQEMEALVLTLDLEQGVAPIISVDFWHRDLDPLLLTTRLQEAFGPRLQVHGLDPLPPLSEGLARRMWAPRFLKFPLRPVAGQAVLDLIPVTWRATAGLAAMKQRMVVATIVGFGLWALATLAFLGGFYGQKHRLKALETRLADLQKPAEAVRLLQRQARSFKQYLDCTYSALECLREVSQALPPEVTLTTFQYKNGKTITLRGEALTVNPIYDFKQALDKSGLFKRADMGSTQPSKRKETTVQTFQMTLQLPEAAP